MWNCKNCEEKIEDSFDTCWNCGYDKTGEKIMSESFEETKKETKESHKYSSLKTYKKRCEFFKILMILGIISGVVQSIRYESWIVFIISIFSFIITMTILNALTLSIKFLFDLDTKIQNDK